MKIIDVECEISPKVNITLLSNVLFTLTSEKLILINITYTDQACFS